MGGVKSLETALPRNPKTPQPQVIDMENIVNEIACPCGGQVEWDDTYDYEIQESQKRLVLYKTGTCKKCQKTVDYNVSYTLADKKIEIIDTYAL